jgi:2-amino-4-hydroxy-6-hydroxymethyldihydropteridine diphosphokinase
VEDDDVDGGHQASLATPAGDHEEEADPMASPRRRTAYVGLGANIGDAAATLAEAIHALAALPGVRLRGVSRLYATSPVGVVDQPDFRNAVVVLDVPAGPDPATGAVALLIALKGLETAFGRQARERWGPRELDLDLLVFGRARLSIERPAAARSIEAAVDSGKAARLLEVPHRDAHERLFVLQPLADLAPGLIPPGWGETVETARRRHMAAEGTDAARPIARWDRRAGAWVSDRPGSYGSRRRPAGPPR